MKEVLRLAAGPLRLVVKIRAGGIRECVSFAPRCWVDVRLFRFPSHYEGAIVSLIAEGHHVIQWANTKAGYGWLSIALHWLAAIAIIAMLVTGFRADWAGDAGDRAGRSMLMGWHISLGASFAFILLARGFANYAQPRPTPPEQAPPLKFLSSATHQLLLIAIVIQVISGPLAVWSGGRAINVFDLFSIPGPFAERNEGVHEAAELLHAVGRWAIVVLLSLHILGALKHALIDRDGVMRRMLAPAKS
jgi:cytochrome b561